jgi:hypothetical protein
MPLNDSPRKRTSSFAPADTARTLVPLDKDRSERAAAIDRERLGDSQGVETARVEALDLSPGQRLADGAGESLAGRGAAAGISIVTDAGNPSAGSPWAAAGLPDRTAEANPGTTRSTSFFHMALSPSKRNIRIE